jgi:hypothetical protein
MSIQENPPLSLVWVDGAQSPDMVGRELGAAVRLEVPTIMVTRARNAAAVQAIKDCAGLYDFYDHAGIEDGVLYARRKPVA